MTFLRSILYCFGMVPIRFQVSAGIIRMHLQLPWRNQIDDYDQTCEEARVDYLDFGAES